MMTPGAIPDPDEFATAWAAAWNAHDVEAVLSHFADDAVFTCFAPTGNPTIAVGVIVKGGGFGADAAAPIALKIIQAYLGLR
jgi:hypothetical protein